MSSHSLIYLVKKNSNFYFVLPDIKCSSVIDKECVIFLLILPSIQFVNRMCCLLCIFVLYSHHIELSFSEPSLAEKKFYADLCEKLEGAQKLLGQAYCVLVLGIGMEYHHHMACGQ